MNWDKIEGQRNQHKDKVMSKWGKLNNDDIDSIRGKRTELLGLIRTRCGRTQAQDDLEID